MRAPSAIAAVGARIIEHVEEVEALYKNLELGAELRLQTEQVVLEGIAELRENAGAERQQLVARQRRALRERAKLLEAHYADAIPLDLLRIEQERIARELEHVEDRLASLELRFDTLSRTSTKHCRSWAISTVPTTMRHRSCAGR